MKRMLCILLCGLLLLTGCQKPAPRPAETPSTVPTTTTAPSTTTTTQSYEEEVVDLYNQLIEAFLQAWQAGDAQGVRRFTGAAESATLLAEEVAVESYRVEPSTDGRPHRLTLSVSVSRVPAVPVGESEWWIRGTGDYDGFFVELCPIDEDYTARWAHLGTYKDLAVWFCNEMATELNLFDTVENFSRLSPEKLGAQGGTLVRLHNAWLKVAEEDADLPNRVSASDLTRFTEQVLGATVTDFSASPTYIPATETEEAQVELEGYGGRWHYAGLVDHTEKDGVHTVTIRYFADITRLVEAVTVRYTAQELDGGGLRLLACQRLSGGDYPPVVGTT